MRLQGGRLCPIPPQWARRIRRELSGLLFGEPTGTQVGVRKMPPPFLRNRYKEELKS